MRFLVLFRSLLDNSTLSIVNKLSDSISFSRSNSVCILWKGPANRCTSNVYGAKNEKKTCKSLEDVYRIHPILPFLVKLTNVLTWIFWVNAIKYWCTPSKYVYRPGIWGISSVLSTACFTPTRSVWWSICFARCLTVCLYSKLRTRLRMLSLQTDSLDWISVSLSVRSIYSFVLVSFN